MHNPGRPTMMAIMAIAALVLALSSAHLMAEEEQGAIPGLTLTSENPGELVISWNEPEPAPSDYRISWTPTSKGHIGWQDDNEADRGNAYPQGTERSHTVTDLPAGEDYKVRMRTRYNAGQYADDPWSGPWEKATITLANEPEHEAEPTTTPSAPTDLSGRLQDGDVTLSWTAPPQEVTGYRIFRGPSSKKLSILVSDTGSSATTHTDDSVSAGNTYHYAVAAINSAGTGQRTESISVKIPSAAREDTPPTTSTSEPNPGDLSATTSTTGVVAPDSAAKGYVKAITDWFDTDWFKASLTASQEYRIEMLGSPTVTSCTIKGPIIYGIYDPSGNLIANTEWAHDDRTHYDKLNFTPDTDGDYYVALTGDTGGNHGIGTYILALTTAGTGSDTRITTVGNAGCFTHTPEPAPTPTPTPHPSAPTIKRGQVNAATVTFTFNENLDSSSTPAASAFTVKVDGSAVNLASTTPVSISDANLTITLGAAVAADQKVTASYSTPSTDSIQDAAGNDAAAFTDRKLSNVTPPRLYLRVTNVQFSDEALYSSGDNLDITVTLDHAATVGENSAIHGLGNHEPDGSLFCKDDDGVVSSKAVYHSGSGTAQIVFRCVVHDEGTTRVSVGRDRVHIVGTSPDSFVRRNPAYEHTTSAHGLAGPTVTDITINNTSGNNGTWDPGDTVEISYVFSEDVIVGGTPKLHVQSAQVTDFVGRETLQYARVENDNTVVFSAAVSGKSRKSYRLPANAIRLDRGYIAQSGTEALADLSHRGRSGSTALVPPCGSTIPGHVWCAKMIVGADSGKTGYESAQFGSLDVTSTTYGNIDRLYYGQSLNLRFDLNGLAGGRPRNLLLTLGERYYDISTAEGLPGHWNVNSPGGVRWPGNLYDPQFTHGDGVTVRLVRAPLVVSIIQGAQEFTANEGDKFTFEFQSDKPVTTNLDIRANLAGKAYSIQDGPGPRTGTIPAGQSRGQLELQIVDDDILDNNHDITMTIFPSDRYAIGTLSNKVRIINGSYVDELDEDEMPTGNIVFDIDDDNARAGWGGDCNSTTNVGEPAKRITVAEDVGTADVATVVEHGLVGYDFNTILVNSEASASRHNDYVHADASGNHYMGALQRSAPLSIGIVDRDQLEDTEEFYVWLFDGGLSDQIAIGCKYLVIEITDDDTANLLVEQQSQTVTEGDTISFNVVVENETGQCLLPFPIYVSAEPSTGAALLETDDQVSKSVRFPPCEAEKTFEFETVVTAGTQADQTVVIEVATATDTRISLMGQSSVHRYTVTVVDDGN